MAEPQQPEPIVSETGPISQADVARVNTALEETKGDRVAAAKILGVDKARVNYVVVNTASLKARWHDPREDAETPALQPEQLVNRSMPASLSLTPTERMASALVVSERTMNRSLAKLGFRKEEIESISSMEEFAGQYFQQTLSIMHGGMVKSGMRLMMLAQQIEEEYLSNDSLEERDRKWWWDQYFRILENLRAMHDQANKAALTKSIIEIKKKESESGRGPGGKAGFTPLAPTVNVQINNGKEKSVKATT